MAKWIANALTTICGLKNSKKQVPRFARDDNQYKTVQSLPNQNPDTICEVQKIWERRKPSPVSVQN
jgi:hypothetical protein